MSRSSSGPPDVTRDTISSTAQAQGGASQRSRNPRLVRQEVSITGEEDGCVDDVSSSSIAQRKSWQSTSPHEMSSLSATNVSLDMRRASAPVHGIQHRRQLFQANRPETMPEVQYKPVPRITRQPTQETYNVEKNEEEDTVNQYSFLGNIGQGAYGVVREAQGGDNERYAIKIMSKRRLSRIAKQRIFGRPPRAARGGKPQSDPLEQVKREIAILKSLDHPNIIKLKEVMDDPEQDDLYLVFELMQNGPVMTEKMDETFDESQAYTYFIDLMLGVEYLHCRHIIHRDIKPENLLLDDAKSHIKISDFGVSELFDAVQRDARLNKTSGTPAFLAPEAVQVTERSAKVDYSGRAADVWAMGVTLYCFVFGRLPFQANNVVDLYELIREAPLEFPEDIQVSGLLYDFLTRLLEKNPAKRITVDEMREHPWITQEGRAPIPSKEENCKAPDELSEEAVASAFSNLSFSALASVLMMIKTKSFRRQRSLSPSPQNSLERDRTGSIDSASGFLANSLGRDTAGSHLHQLTPDMTHSLPGDLSYLRGSPDSSQGVQKNLIGM